jgi:hypothetical protein
MPIDASIRAIAKTIAFVVSGAAVPVTPEVPGRNFRSGFGWPRV